MENVEEYSHAHELQRRDASDVIEEFSDEIAEMRGRCIDIGCGPGDITKDLVLSRIGRDAILVGADISETMVSFARTRYKDEKRLSFVNLDIQTLNLPEREISRYDGVLSFYCLHWCQNMRLTFGNVFKLLRPGGKALVTFLAYNNGFDAYEEIYKNPLYQPYMKDMRKFVPVFHYSANPRASLKKILEESGFEVLHCSRREKTFVFKNSDVLRKHIVAVNPFLTRIPENLKEEFKNDLLQEITNQKIVFASGNNDIKDQYSILDRYYLFVAYFRKPEVE